MALKLAGVTPGHNQSVITPMVRGARSVGRSTLASQNSGWSAKWRRVEARPIEAAAVPRFAVAALFRRRACYFQEGMNAFPTTMFKERRAEYRMPFTDQMALESPVRVAGPTHR